MSPQDISDRSRHHPGTANEFRLPCRNIARRVNHATGFYSGHTPPLRRFNHLSDQTQAPGTNPAAAEVPALVMLFAPRFTLLSSVTWRNRCRMCDSSESPQFPSGMICHSRRFQGTERRSVPLPISTGLSRFGIVSRGTHWQAITRLSWLSYSQPSDLPTVPGLITSGLARHRAQCSPRQPG